jgi:hypothetical protein
LSSIFSYRVSIKKAVIPKKLQQLCEDVIDRQPLPEALSWSIEKFQQFDANNMSGQDLEKELEFFIFEYYKVSRPKKNYNRFSIIDATKIR